MAKAGIVYVGTNDGLVTYSDPGSTGHWRRIGHTLVGHTVHGIIAADGDDGALVVIVSLDANDARISLDGAQTWGPAPAAEAEALQDLRQSSRPLIATAQGMAQWTGAHPPAPGAQALAMLAGKQETLLAAIAEGTQLLYSNDGGANWVAAQLTTPLQGAITVFAPSSYHMDTCWAGTDTGQILRSDDRGQSWVEVAQEAKPIHAMVVMQIR
ncbi:hypothetical protein OSCT_1259 [Oscillochloris trichoides DG-6]|uniref:Uncharacterized protein n=1 Tax=Oscillochloris trichoides DG-6 TaxID=765420 RepID=E1ID58_9CHLR|nr:hypothetical protein [Oscillochloris trichoides]EFO80890.1 hypothetical protein OSCT_1259 [Oscillochloris trichoides DG-6]